VTENRHVDVLEGASALGAATTRFGLSGLSSSLGRHSGQVIDLAFLAIDGGERFDLRFQDVAVNWLGQIVDRAEGIGEVVSPGEGYVGLGEVR
jgi:hypothetical protein